MNEAKQPQTQTSPVGRRLARPKDCAEYLKLHISKFWDLVKNADNFPTAFKPSERVTLFDLNEIDEWLEDRRCK